MKITETLRRHRGGIIAGLVLAVIVGWIYSTHGNQFSREALMSYGKKLSPAWLIPAFLILPLVGMPISVLLVLAGIRFGLWGGMVLATCGVLFHHLVTYHLVHRWLWDRVQGRLRRSGYEVPIIEGANQAWLTVLFAAIHGPPYAFKLYLLALTEIPFRIYFWAGAPVYILFCLVPVGAGSAVMEVNTTLLYGIVVGITVLALSGKWLKRRFRLES
jgi:uncharacterized membrane protein YdjX (TVP38/TMEM64 family)